MSDFSIENIDGITVVRFHERLSLEQIFEAINTAADFSDSNRRLWNLGAHLVVTGAEIKQIAQLGRSRWPEPARVAYVSSNDLGIATLKLFEAYRTQDLYQTRVFRDENEALEWLENP